MLPIEEDSDWQTVATLSLDAEPESRLMPEAFAQVIEYDALNRMTRQYNWHKGTGSRVAVYEPNYNERGLLLSEDLAINTIKTEDGYTNGSRTHAIVGLTYNAKGQRESIAYGNNTDTTYEYDQKTFRLAHLQTKRKSDNKILQDLYYTYDPNGNITEIKDNAQPTVFFNNSMVHARNRYTYDALYRLIEAEGREHAGQLQYDSFDNWNDCAFRKKYQPGDALTWRNYTQRYEYDSVGNILTMRHIAQGDTANSWTRQYQYATASNRLLATGMGTAPVEHYVGTPILEYKHDYNEHGSMTSMSHLSVMEWDFTEHLHHISRRAPGTQGIEPDDCPDTSLEAWYRYDATKERTRKVVKKQGGRVEERLYLGGFEIFRKRDASGAVLLERETLHLMDDKQRIALIDIKTIDDQSPIPEIAPIIRYQMGNHLGSVNLELDEKGEMISYEEYHSYGTTAYHAVRNDSGVGMKSYRYTGKERDEESGFNYHGVRYYAQSFGRWVSCDPAGSNAACNSYFFVSCNPISWSDPSGKDKEPVTVTLNPSYLVTLPQRGTLGYFARGGVLVTPEEDAATKKILQDAMQEAEETDAADRLTGAGGAEGGGYVPRASNQGARGSPNEEIELHQEPQDENGQELTRKWKEGTTAEKVEIAATVGGTVGGVIPYAGDYVALTGSIIIFGVHPSWSGASDIGLDAVGAALPFVPAMGTIHRMEKLVAAADFTHDLEKLSKARSAVKKGVKLESSQKEMFRIEARLLAEEKLELPASWVVHHRRPLEYAHLFPNLDPNSLENLAMMTPGMHIFEHQMWSVFRYEHKLRGTVPRAVEVEDAARIIQNIIGRAQHKLP